ncbi:nitrous oxide reductase accessory protein NosL [Muriicola sp. E247]|uniref:nitrous oxide reductase accessory protein NosL n=1 Tax=unclassified Muriicola TaxID=2647561 RepID=UPI0035105778
MKKVWLLITFLIIGYGCSRGPKPIDYGSDGCHYCRMTIVDRQHAAEIVTQKGRVYKFDATECMLNQLKDFEEVELELFLVNDYDSPGTLIDATKATFLISKNIPSPMGEFLTAFKTPENAQEAKNVNGGELYTWDELKVRFEN